MTRLLALCLISGCAVSPGGGPTGDDDPEPEPAQPRPLATVPYHITTQIDVTAEVLLPARAEQAVATLRAFSIHPARTLIATAGEAGVPAVADLYDALPGPLQDRLEGWLDAELARVTIDGTPLPAHAGEIAALAETALTQFALDATLTVERERAHHRLTALDLTDALGVRVALEDAPGELVEQTPTATLAADGALALGDQRFGLAYGAHVWQALEAASVAQHGGGLRARLDAVPCAAIARRVADRCVLGACVGHAAELTQLCERGLDALVEAAHDRVAALRFDALHLAAGRALLIDDDGDRVADRVTAGTWQAELDLGQGLRPVPATFHGSR